MTIYIIFTIIRCKICSDSIVMRTTTVTYCSTIIIIVHCLLLYLVTTVLSELDTANDLLIDEISGDAINARIMPRSKDFLPKEEPPWSIALGRALLLSILLTLRDCIHYVIATTTQRGYL